MIRTLRPIRRSNRKQVAVALLLTLFCATGGFQPAVQARNLVKSYEVENKVYKLSVQGDELLRQGKYLEAQNVYLQAATFDPTSYSGRLHLSLADCYQNQQNIPEAINQAKSAYALDPAQTNALYMLALIYYKAEKYNSCLATLNDYLKVADGAGRVQAQELLARVKSYDCTRRGAEKLRDGQVPEAIKLLELAATADPSLNSSCIHGNLCFAYRQSGNLDKSIAEGKKALQFDAKDTTVMYNLAINYQDQGNFDVAIGWLQRYLLQEKNPTNKAQAKQLISELLDDRSKLTSANNKMPDYLELLKNNDHLWTWPKDKLPLKVYIASGKNVDGYKSVFRAYVIKALDTWCEASGKKIRYEIVKTKADADLKVRWTTFPLNSESEPRLAAGVTTLSQENGLLSEASINLRTTDAFTDGAYVKNGEMAAVIMHEVGHALGLDHSNSIYDIMYFRAFSKQTGQPTKRDRSTMALLYANHPVVSFTPNAEAAAVTTTVVFAPPPSFVPPKPPDEDKLVPPLFLPPPLNEVKEKLTPPLFTPPPISAEKKSDKPVSLPAFLPPALKKSDKKSASPNDGKQIQFFMPPPAKP